MSVFEIIETFSLYGVDIIALSAFTSVIVQVLKLTLLKKAQKKVLTFLPFFLGTLFYSIYCGLYNWSFEYVITNYVCVCEHGFAVGVLATFIYVLYEQFIRCNTKLTATESVVLTLIEGYVPDDKTEATAKAVAEAIAKDVTGTGATKTAEILLNNCQEGVSEKDIKLLAKLIIESLAHVSTP